VKGAQALIIDINTWIEKLARDKHLSLFCLKATDKEGSSVTL